MKFSPKLLAIVAGILLAVALLAAAVNVTTMNRVIYLEEAVQDAQAAIGVEEKRRVDLVYNLVDAVQELTRHEQEMMVALAEARTLADNGDGENAALVVKAVAEAYPELKADAAYLDFMTELTMTENAIRSSRNAYNKAVRAHRQYIRQWPASAITRWNGYENEWNEYTEYNAPVDAPQNLFRNE